MTDETTLEGGAGPSGADASGLGTENGLKHIQSTARMAKVPSGVLVKAVGSPSEGEKRAAEGIPGVEYGIEPSAKRRKALSVHFEGISSEEDLGDAQ